MLLDSADRDAARPAVADPMTSLDYGSLARLAAVMRRHVEKATTAPHVGLLMPSTCAFVGTFYGILWAGRTAVPLNFLLQASELAAVARDAGLDVVFTIKHFRDLAEALPVRVVYVEDLPLKREVVLQRVRKTPSAPRGAADDMAVLLYTSGTSGQPKGVCQTYGNLASNVAAGIEKAQLVGEHRFLGLLPLSHSFGLTATMLIPIKLGASSRYLPRFQPTAVLEAIGEHRASVTMMVASMYTALFRVRKGGPADLASMTYAMAGGEALPDAVFERFKERFGVEILQGYGMSEASPVVSLNVPGSNRVGTVGQAIPGVTVRAHDDDGKSLGPGEIGELWLKGPGVMAGYYKRPEDTRAVLSDDGWYKTGDMGRLDADGFIAITGRKKEMIIVGGENVYPREIESVLDEHPAVAESAAIGQPDASRGEVVVAFVTLADGCDAGEIELRDFCRDRLAGFKAPRRVIISSDLPRGPTGKILKRKLRELL